VPGHSLAVTVSAAACSAAQAGPAARPPAGAGLAPGRGGRRQSACSHGARRRFKARHIAGDELRLAGGRGRRRPDPGPAPAEAAVEDLCAPGRRVSIPDSDMIAQAPDPASDRRGRFKFVRGP
jgi:hypothetical protein